VLLGGAFTTVNNSVRAGFARLDSSGTLDPAAVGVGRNDVTVLGVQSDGKVLIGGTFVNFNGTVEIVLRV
jgi:hypothetical protein